MFLVKVQAFSRGHILLALGKEKSSANELDMRPYERAGHAH